MASGLLGANALLANRGYMDLYGDISSYVLRIAPCIPGGLADRLGFRPSLFAAPLSEGVKVPDDSAFQPSTLFLTGQRDPTTTMTVQWVKVS
jgi:hypothetical protein